MARERRPAPFPPLPGDLPPGLCASWDSGGHATPTERDRAHRRELLAWSQATEAAADGLGDARAVYAERLALWRAVPDEALDRWCRCGALALREEARAAVATEGRLLRIEPEGVDRLPASGR